MSKFSSILLANRQKTLLVGVLVFAFALVGTSAFAALTFTNDDITSDEDFVITGVEASTLTVTSGSAAEDLTISLTGATDSSLHLSSTGTGADAMTLTTTAGGLDISVTGTAAGEDLDISTVGATTEMRFASASTENDAIDINASAGGIDIDATTGTFTMTNLSTGAADDFTIELTGATDSSLHMSSTGTAADALTITASAGGIDITASGAAAGEDIDVTTTSSINLTATENAALGIDIETNGGTSETLRLYANQGTGYNSIELLSDAGGVQVHPGLGFTFGGAVNTATAGAGTYTAAQFCGSVLQHDPNGGAAAGTTPTAAQLIGACVPTNGDSHELLFRNTADAAEVITVTAGANITLVGPANTDDLVGQNEWAHIKFTNLDGTTVLMEIDDLVDAD